MLPWNDNLELNKLIQEVIKQKRKKMEGKIPKNKENDKKKQTILWETSGKLETKLMKPNSVDNVLTCRETQKIKTLQKKMSWSWKTLWATFPPWPD